MGNVLAGRLTVQGRLLMALLSVLSRRRLAFTLVELLTVIGIIALLIGILVPSLVPARDLAKKTKTAAELRSISTSLEMFRTDFKEYPESNTIRMVCSDLRRKGRALWNG